MRITLSTYVSQSLSQVWTGFDEQLFNQLAPPFPPVRLRRFDGSHTGDEVHLELNFFLFQQSWHSRIVEHRVGETDIYFVDQGIRLPFFLTYWRHRHRLRQHGEGTEITDDIEYEGPTRLLEYLLYPVLYAQFWYRRPIYQRVFSQPALPVPATPDTV